MRKRHILVAISVVVFALVIYYADPAMIAGHLSQADYRFIPLMFLAGTLSLTLRVLRWDYLLKPAKQIPVSRLVPIQFAGLAISNLTPGKVGEAGKSLFLKKYEGMPVSTSIASIIWERLLDLSLLIVLTIPLMIMLLERLSQNVLYIGTFAVAFIVAIIVLAIFAVHNQKVGFSLLKIFQKIPVVKNHLNEGFVKSFYQCSKMPTRLILVGAAMSVLIWFVDGGLFLLAFRSLGIADISLLSMTAVLAFSILVGVVSFLPGGLGSAEFVFIFMLGLLGIEKSPAAAGVIVGRVFSLFYCYFLGMLSILYLARKKTAPTKA